MHTRLVAAVIVAGAVAGPAQARDQINIVGSSTVYPFATVVAENFGRGSDFKTPKIEATGSGGGMKLFCAGLGTDYPDIANASRRMKSSELEKCRANGVQDVVEIKIGYDGIVIANARTAPEAHFTLRHLFLALAKQVPEGNQEGGKLVNNPNETWADVDPALPDVAIEVLGPPPTSGTRDAFNELAVEGGCKTFPGLTAIKQEDKNRYKAICRGIREDGAYIEAGENDNLIVQKLAENPNALGVFGFSFLDQNRDAVKGASIDGVTPEFDDIATRAYPVSRPLYFYVKKAHVDVIPGIREYISAFTSDDAWGDEGYLTDRGLIPLPTDERTKFVDDAANLTPLESL
ncbi:MAG: substrate-binding domain-containing protein [Rhodospirillales bacterium]|nr:substrate-binding domain-containing protein [Rhodospirillales bacterium]MCY4002404.1 substrate-binding domain-containing protein [Rhodospirillales bacterium]MXX21748.1 phosphate ABC transporter substrate-binding protein [Rhodospirillales bacterium]